VIREILLLLLTPVKSVSNQMKTETYHFEQNETATLFVFFSEGRQGRIMKAIIISPYDRNRWNLAFGDVGADLEIDDKAKTNNNDLVKVLGTVAQAAILFSDKYPERSIMIFPVDAKQDSAIAHQAAWLTTHKS